MPWNWQLPDWPEFTTDFDQVFCLERQFLLETGKASAFLKNVDEMEKNNFIVEILSVEGFESSKIEGEILQRMSLQSSIKKQFGFVKDAHDVISKEASMAEVLHRVYETFDQPLTHEMLCHWHAILFQHSTKLEEIGRYRTHSEPMQIVSGRLDRSEVFFEAPPSNLVPREMERFIEWFNATEKSNSLFVRAAIAHVYFESIHPFEDGNGRIGRLLSEKILSQGVGCPVLIALSKFIEQHKKKYYAELGKCNRTLNASSWVEFFSEMILQSQKHAMRLIVFLIEKAKMLSALSGQLNPRQEKALLRMFAEGPDGFLGGLSAEKYIAITKATRSTATRDLVELVQKGALIKTGELRHTRYWLNISTID